MPATICSVGSPCDVRSAATATLFVAGTPLTTHCKQPRRNPPSCLFVQVILDFLTDLVFFIDMAWRFHLGYFKDGRFSLSDTRGYAGLLLLLSCLVLPGICPRPPLRPFAWEEIWCVCVGGVFRENGGAVCRQCECELFARIKLLAATKAWPSSG